jgi:hypothetical protein
MIASNDGLAVERPAPQDQTVVYLDGPRAVDAHGGTLAELAEDGRWYTPEGAVCSGLKLPAPRLMPAVSSEAHDAARRGANEAWMEGAHDALRNLASRRREITSDDVWAALPMPPRESRMIGNALSWARSVGLFERTDEHRPSTRSENHSRPVRVWRSLYFDG